MADGPNARALGPAPMYALLRSLDHEWQGVAAAFGLGVVREPGAYVSTLGDAVIRVAPYEDLDPDDCLAQIVLHELCHFAVEGPGSARLPDWGLDNETDADAHRERAAIRAQAAITGPFGLRRALAPTTEFRLDYDRLPDDPLEGPERETEPARSAVGALRAHPAWPTLAAALGSVAARVRGAEAG